MHKIRLFFAFVFLLLISACSMTKPFGSHIEQTIFESDTLSSDAVALLEKIKRPAATRLNFKHEATDNFGVALTNKLRLKGYAISEYPPKKGEPIYADGFDFRYIVDGIDDTMFRLTLMVGGETISRPYIRRTNGLQAVSFWTRKE